MKAERAEELKAIVCDQLCKYPCGFYRDEDDHQYMIDHICNKCEFSNEMDKEVDNAEGN